jgi:hypothetical protein
MIDQETEVWRAAERHEPTVLVRRQTPRPLRKSRHESSGLGTRIYFSTKRTKHKHKRERARVCGRENPLPSWR